MSTWRERDRRRREQRLNRRSQSPPPIFGPDRGSETPDPECGEHSDHHHGGAYDDGSDPNDEGGELFT